MAADQRVPRLCPALSQKEALRASTRVAAFEAVYCIYCLLTPGTKPQWAAPQAPAHIGKRLSSCGTAET